MQNYQVLVASNDPKHCNIIGWALKDGGLVVSIADNIDAAYAEVNRHRYDLILAELALEQDSHYKLLCEAKRRDPETIVILLGCNGSTRGDIESLPFEADDYILQECSVAMLWKRVSNCLERMELKRKDAHCRVSRKLLINLSRELSELQNGEYGELGQAVRARLYSIQDGINQLIDGAETLLRVADPDVVDRRVQ
jgi:DNA-binding response OmpR family regulator